MKKLPYLPPLIEVEQYCVEIGVEGSFSTNNQELTEWTEAGGDNDVPGDWSDDGTGSDWFDF